MIAPEAVADQRKDAARPAVDWPLRIAWIGIIAFVIALTIIAFGREVFNYNTETDFLGGFMSEAHRFLSGESLEVHFHPPLYAMTIASVYVLVQDWFATGLLISLVASAATLAISLVLLRKALGTAAAIGGVLALALSPTFVYYSLQATSELFSLALYLAAFLAVYLSTARRTVPYHLLAGVVIGLALLTRTNHIVLLGLLLFYFVPVPSSARPTSPTGQLRGLGWVAAGIGLPLLAWFAFAAGTASPLMPTKNHENFALTYFSPGSRISGDERFALAPQFTSTMQVLTADPARIVRIYSRDLVTTTFRLLARDTVLPFPLIAISLLCWLAIAIRERQKRAWIAVLLLNLLAMYMLLNFKMYEHRYYLYLLPFLGASIGIVFTYLLRPRSPNAVRLGSWVVLAVMIGFAAYSGVTEATRLHAGAQSTDAYAAARYFTSERAPAGSVVYSRKSHIGFYSGVQREWMPNEATLDELIEYVVDARRQAPASVFLFYGVTESSTRPQYAALADPGSLRVPQLTLVASGSERGGWFLYQLLDADD